MKKVKAALQKILHPPCLVTAAVSLAGYTGMAWALVTRQTGISAALAYGLSAYTLVIDIAALPGVWGVMKAYASRFAQHSRLFRKINGTAFGKSYLNNCAFRANVSIYQGMAANFLYTVFRAVTGIQYASVWFLSMAAYHFCLGALRAYLIFSMRRRPEGKSAVSYEYRCCKTIGKLLLLLNIPMSGMVVLMIQKNSGFTYPGIVIYVSALYTFYTAILSIVNLVKIRSLESPLFFAAKILNFISAAMSVLGLQTSMISRFGGGNDSFRRTMNTFTGTGVCIIVMGAAVYMISAARKNIGKAERQ